MAKQRMKKNKKGQTSLEFMVTYGWIFVVIITMFGALQYFGLLNVKNYFPEDCDFGKQARCNDALLSLDNDEVRFNVTNGFGVNFKVKNQKLFFKNTEIDCNSEKISDGIFWGDGQSKEFLFQDCDLDRFGFLNGDKYELVSRITFYAEGSADSYEHILRGELFIEAR